jgi:predicted nuclease with TOPRIM domain
MSKRTHFDIVSEQLFGCDWKRERQQHKQTIMNAIEIENERLRDALTRYKAENHKLQQYAIRLHEENKVVNEQCERLIDRLEQQQNEIERLNYHLHKVD